MQRTSTRVVTAIAAFVVFALAISLFAIPTLRLHEGSSARRAGGQLLPLWPARTMEQVQALQAQAESGDTAWALDPQQVAVKFGQMVLGWPQAAAIAVPSDQACNATLLDAAVCPAAVGPTAGSMKSVGVAGCAANTHCLDAPSTAV